MKDKSCDWTYWKEDCEHVFVSTSGKSFHLSVFWLTPGLSCFDPKPSEQGPPVFHVPATTMSSDQLALP